MDDQSDASVTDRIGRTLCNKYTLDKIIGVGGMAAVYRGKHRNGNPVAVKVLHTELCASKDLRERFLREGYVANKVEHPGAVRVLDDDTAEDGAVFLVMELLEGETFEDCIVRHNGRMSVRELVPIACQLLEVLVAAHEKGIVHRDIKPENIFIQRRDGTVKVLDFGIARLADAGRNATRTGRVMGTPGYMSPEQARGLTKLIDGQTDIWAVGATLFRAVTGRVVHEAETPELTMIQAATQPAPAVRELVPTIDEGFATLVDNALVADKARRWPTATAMLSGFRSLNVDGLPAARPLTVSSTVMQGPSGVSTTEPSGVSSTPLRGATSIGQPLPSAFVSSSASSPGAGSTVMSVPEMTHVPSAPSAPSAGGSRAPLIIVGALGMAILGALGVAAALGALSKKDHVTPSAALVASAESQSAPSSSAPVDLAAGSLDDAAASDTSDTSDAATIPTTPPLDPVAASAASAAPAAAAAAPHHPSTPAAANVPAPPARPTGGNNGSFDRGAASAALGGVNVQSCGRPDGPTGAGHATITFAPTGGVSLVLLNGGPFAGTPVGGCIVGKYRAARVPAFAGDPVSVGKSFMIAATAKGGFNEVH